MNSFKILQINTWTGRIKDGLTRFIKEGGFDVVCMQEAVWLGKGAGFLDAFVDTVDKIKKAGGFQYDFRSTNYGIKMFDGVDRCEQGNVILSKIPFKATEEKVLIGDYYVADGRPDSKDVTLDHRYTAQKVTLENGFVIVNYHGYWLKDPLGDRLTTKCMKQVADMIREEESPVVMCGDLNIVSEAPAMRELDFLTDLTALNKVKTTLRNVKFEKDVACDHILVSKNVSYRDFKVIDAKVSDHMALSVEILV